MAITSNNWLHLRTSGFMLRDYLEDVRDLSRQAHLCWVAIAVADNQQEKSGYGARLQQRHQALNQF